MIYKLSHIKRSFHHPNQSIIYNRN